MRFYFYSATPQKVLPPDIGEIPLFDDESMLLIDNHGVPQSFRHVVEISESDPKLREDLDFARQSRVEDKVYSTTSPRLFRYPGHKLTVLNIARFDDSARSWLPASDPT